MAYMNQERKKDLAPGIKSVLKKYGMVGTIAVRHHSTLVVNVKAGALDIVGNYCQNIKADRYRNDEEADIVVNRIREQCHIQVNNYWIGEHFTGTVSEFLTELHHAMNIGNHDRSDMMTDYFDVGWYADVNVGQYGKPYIFEN